MTEFRSVPGLQNLDSPVGSSGCHSSGLGISKHLCCPGYGIASRRPPCTPTVALVSSADLPSASTDHVKCLLFTTEARPLPSGAEMRKAFLQSLDPQFLDQGFFLWGWHTNCNRRNMAVNLQIGLQNGKQTCSWHLKKCVFLRCPILRQGD